MIDIVVTTPHSAAQSIDIVVYFAARRCLRGCALLCSAHPP
jgi:hypothetical protein